MSDELCRLKDWDDALIKSVLESAARDAPSSERVRRAAMNLGLPAAAAARVVAAGHAASAGSTLGGAGAAASSSAGSVALGGTGALVAKWLGIGALVGLATGGVAGRVLDRAPSHAAPQGTAHAAPSKLAPVFSPRTVHATRALAPRPEPLPSVAATAARAPRLAPVAPPALATSLAIGPAPSSAVAAFPAAAPRDNLGAELRMVGATRQALARGDAAGALSKLDRYAREVPHPQFGVEALMLRVRALVALGRRGEARAIGERYIARHPGDIYAAKLRALLGP